MKLLNTNSKEYNKNIEDYIFNCIDLDYFELKNNPTDKKEILEIIAKEIKNISFYENNIKRFKNNKCYIIADFLQGLPSFFNVDFENYNILKVAAKLHNLEILPTNKQDIILNNWFNHISFKFLQLCKKYKVNYYVFTTTIHDKQLNSINEVNKIKEYYDWKIELSKITPYWDFMYKNTLSSKNENFIDTSHLKIDFVKYYLNTIFNDNPIENYGIYIDDKNINNSISLIKQKNGF